MPEETVTSETMTPEEVLVEMQKNTVPKSDYEEMRDKYYKLFKATANGLTLGEEPVESEADKEARVMQDVKDLYGKKKSGAVNHLKTLVELHDFMTEKGQRSPFAPSKGDASPATDEQCDALRNLMAEAIEASNGDDTACSTYFATRLDYSGIKSK